MNVNKLLWLIIHITNNKVNLTCNGLSSTVTVVVVLVGVVGMPCCISAYVLFMKPLGIQNYSYHDCIILFYQAGLVAISYNIMILYLCII